MREGTLDQMVADLSRSKAIAFDLETIGLDPQHPRANIICISLCGEPGRSYVVLWDHPENRLPKEEIKEALDSLFAQDKKWIAHNGKFDCLWLNHFGFQVPNQTHDTIIMAHLLDENAPKNVESVASRYLHTPAWKHLMDDHFNDINDALRKGTSIPYPPLADLVKYAAIDTDVELRLYHVLWKKLDKSLRRLHNFLMDVSWVLEAVESVGVYMNPEDLAAKQEEYERKMEECLDIIERETGKRYNPNSPKQMAELLFDKLKLPVVEFTATNSPSSSDHTLKVLRKQSPVVIGAILDYRQAAKYVGSYLRPWRNLLTPDNRLRSSYNLTKSETGGGTVTGRLSCSNLVPFTGTKNRGMSLHQVPRDGDIRTVVSAPPGRIIIAADYSQIELRVAAALAEEPRMMEAYRKGEDIHTLTAATVMGKRVGEVTKEDRQKAKAVNFGFLYGMGARNFVKYAFDEYALEFSLQEAEYIRTEFFLLYRGLRPWHRRVEDFVRRYGFVRSPLGRIRHLPDIHSPDTGLQYEAVRQAINAPVQATASDFTLMAMVLAHKKLFPLYEQGRLFVLGQVHDSILIECDAEIAEGVANILKILMEKKVPVEIKRRFGYHFPVPLAAEIEICHSWGGKSLKTLA